MSGLSKQYADLNAGTSSMMESSMMEGDGFYTPDTAHTVPGAAVGSWPDKTEPSQLCRVCANPNDYLIPIFNGEGVEHNLSMKIQRHLPIEVRESDSLPVHICYQCATTLMAWHDLVTTCVEADKKLRELQEREEDDDDDDKTAQFYEGPSMDSDTGEEPGVHPSTSTTVAKTKAVSSPPTTRKSLASKRPKQKTAPTRLSQRSPSKLLQPAKPKEDSERCQPTPPTPFKALHQAQSALRNLYQQRNHLPDNRLPHLDWIKMESEQVGEPLHGCRRCSECFGKGSELAEHVGRVHPEWEEPSEDEPWSDPGDESYVPPSRCTARRRARLGCNECGRTFSRLYDLSRHTKCHLSPEKGVQELVELDPSPTLSPVPSPLLEPRKRRSSRTFHCDQCGKNFTLKDSYFRHQRIHTGERPFTCHICGKQFRDSGGLARHLKDVHAGIKNFGCEICGRTFASKATREDHRRTHTGERPYICHSCGKTFKSKASLYTHSKTHTDSFPHPCTSCEKRFRRKQELLAHESTHTGLKPHVCDECSKSFRVRGELLRHKLIHSEEKPYVCAACGLGFRQKRYLKNHEMKRHDRRDVILDSV